MSAPNPEQRHLRHNPGAVREASVEAVKSLRHWTILISVAAVIPVAHWMAANQGSSDNPGLIYGASFAVFALILPAVGILRDYIDRRMARLQEVFRLGSEASTEVLESQYRMFDRLAATVAPLQRGIVFAMIAAAASSAALVVPDVIVWDHAPGFVVFSLTEILAAVALVCLVSAVAAMFPFTWHLLVRSDQLRFTQAAIQAVLTERQLGETSSQISPPQGGDDPGHSHLPPVGDS